LPVDVLQAMFASLDPFLALNKFTRFAGQDPDSAAGRHFVALEDWLNDGVPLVRDVAKECLFDWYGRNTPGRGLWRVAGDRVEPRAVRCPSLVVVPERDTIVPPKSAEPLGRALPDAETVYQPAGHIGMVAGRNGPAKLYPLVVDWLKARSA
jgi:polyhydroxyalkanoate synthase